MRVLRQIVRCALPLLLVIGCRGAGRQARPVVDPVTTAVGDREPDTFALLAGTWDFARGDTTCKGNPHQISFSADRQAMILTFKTPFDTATGQRVVNYRILARGRDVHREVPHVLRTSMEGETRKTDAGELVLWDIMLATPNRYHWHRTDWADGGVTRGVVRCDGTRPLETWNVP